jgi:hypothetical protein
MARKRVRYSSSLCGDWLLPPSRPASLNSLVGSGMFHSDSQHSDPTSAEDSLENKTLSGDTTTPNSNMAAIVSPKAKTTSRYSRVLPASWVSTKSSPVVHDITPKPDSHSLLPAGRGAAATSAAEPANKSAKPQRLSLPAMQGRLFRSYATHVQSANGSASSASASASASALGDLKPIPPPTAPPSEYFGSLGSGSISGTASLDGCDLPAFPPSVSSNYSN